MDEDPRKWIQKAIFLFLKMPEVEEAEAGEIEEIQRKAN